MIDPERIIAIGHDCMYDETEINAEGTVPAAGVPLPVMVEAVTHKLGFHPARLESHRAEVVAALRQLPHQFFTGKGGGWSFLNACWLENGEQWTGVHRTVEVLLALGQGLGLVELVPRREHWHAFPGGMPYVMITLPPEEGR
jgi:hypothetical protein